jgi:acyl carrier protein
MGFITEAFTLCLQLKPHLLHRTMSITQFIASIESELREADERAFEGGTVLRELPNWSSMLALLLIARIDEVYGVQLSASEFANVRTIAELHALVSQQTVG